MKKILAVLVIVGILFGLSACSMAWPEGKLGRMIPQIKGVQGTVYSESLDDLTIALKNISEGKYLEYVEACKEKGFIVEITGDSNSFTAFNEEGYKIDVSHYSTKEMWIRVYAPMPMSEIEWPSSDIAKLLPVPNSSYGKIQWEADYGFVIYVGNTTKAEYQDYVDAVSALGFTVDYSKGDDYYHADNADGYSVDIDYRGFNTMFVRIDEPDEEKPTTSTTAPSSNNGSSSNSSTSTSGIRPEFKAAMDSYEKFFDEYCAFIKKYQSSSDTTSLLNEYMSFMSRYTETMNNMNALGNTTMNAAELQYYNQVVARINQKLLEVA